MEPSILHRCQAGDTEAFTVVFEQYKNLVFRTAYLVLENHSEAEDILQEVFMRVFHSITSFDPLKGAFSTWLHRITINQCLNERRRRHHSTASLEQIADCSIQEQALSEEQRAEIEAVRQALALLSAKQRSIIILRYYWELSYAEIAEILELPLGTVKSRLNLALHTLHTNLNEQCECDMNQKMETLKCNATK